MSDPILASFTGLVHALEAFLSTVGGADVPLGVVPVAAVGAVLLWFTLTRVKERPQTTRAGTVPVGVVSDSGAPGTVPPESAIASGRPMHHVDLYASRTDRTVLMLGAGESPSVRLPRARTFVLTLVGSFFLLSLVVLLFFPFLFGHYDHLVALVGTLLYWPGRWPGVYTVSSTALVVPDYIFPMYLCAMVAYGLACGLFTNRPRLGAKRRALAFAVLLSYVGAELLLDALFFTVPGSAFRNLALLVRTLLGGLFLALLLFAFFHLPQAQRIIVRFPRRRGAIARFLGLGGLALATGFLLLLLATEFLPPDPLLRTFTLLLLLPAVTLELFALLARPAYGRQVREGPRPSLQEYHPPVSILIPAYNEGRWIRQAILAADRAAAFYPGPVEIVVGNDGSTDDTLAVALRTAEHLEHSTALVVDLPHGGKSNALNGALAVASGEIVIRCDGDTTISGKKGFAAMIAHFADPRVGAVQGAIHPRQTRGWTRKLRAMEIAWNHYFLRPATMGTSSAEVVDGLFSAFRRKDLLEVGGWVPWNGEDTEIAIRLQRMGYTARIEFGALAYEDVPKDYDELRKQRVRWARGILMANGQHYPAVFSSSPEFGGLGVLLWFLMFVHSGVRSLVYLFLLALAVVLGAPALLDTGVLFLIAVLFRTLPIAYFLVHMRRFDALPWVPLFPVLSVLKQAFRFEAFGTLGRTAAAEFV